MTDHDHGLGLSGLRRIRQHNPLRTPTLPSPTSRTPSLGALTRSSSLTTMLDTQPHMTSASPGPGSPTFAEDLSRFPSESLHSFSFAHQSEDLIHNRQNVLKRSIEFMKDRMGWSVAPNAAIASAQARVTGDMEMQSMLDLLARAQLVGASNLPNADQSIPTGPLTGPAEMSGTNVFEKEFIPRVSSPDIIDGPPLSPTATDAQPLPSLVEASVSGPDAGFLQPSSTEATGSEGSSRTSTNESGTTSQTSPPSSKRPSALKRTLTDTAPMSMQQKLMDAIAKPFIPGEGGLPERAAASHSVSAAVHSHGTRWVPAAQAIFTTEAKPPWTILAANDLACLLFGVTKAEVRKMGIMEVVQEERRAWLEKQLQKGVVEDTGDGSESEIAQPLATKPPLPSNLLGGRAGGITAKLLSKPNSRSQTPKNGGRRPATVHSGDPKPPKPGHSHHSSNKSRGVLLCGDVVPIQVSP